MIFCFERRGRTCTTMKKHGFKQGQVDPDIFISKSNELIRQLRVAAYCRVSSKEDQANSYEVQKEYYTDKIMSNPAWTMTGIFADKGITVIFEKENINSLEDSELRITLSGAFAQSESESISANVTWGKRRAMESASCGAV